MGFSVSGSAALMFAGLLVAFGMWSTAAANSVERVTEAEAARTDEIREQRNTAIAIPGATWTSGQLTVTLENRGVSTLRKSEVDLIVDGAYTEFDLASSTSALLRPGNSRELVASLGSAPGRVKVVTTAGIAAAAEVS